MLANRLIGLARVVINEDTFDVDSTAQYTQYADTAGSWSVTGGELVASGGLRTKFIRNGTSFSDVKIEADIDECEDGGLVLRLVDNSNYYFLSLCDDSGVEPSQNLRIRKRTGGSFSGSLSTANISWPRGTSKKIAFEAIGTTLNGYVDGQLLVSAVDSSLASGGVGMRNTGGTTRFQAFRWGL